MFKFFDEFKKFIMRGNVIDLAVAVVIGAAFGKVVDALVADLFMPVIGATLVGIDMSSKSHTVLGVEIRWGHFLQMIINFVIIGFCLFLVVKGMNVLQTRMQKAEDAKPAPEPTVSEKLLMEIRDLLKAKT